jgi:hypothetical protein
MLVRRSVWLLTVLLAFVSVSTLLVAQNVASITGVVTDQTGAVIPNVDVKLSNPQTGVVYKTITNAQGSYTLAQIKPGPGYKIEFTHTGFKAEVVSGLYLNVEATRVQNAQLGAGADVETVEVNAASQTVTLDTTDATVGNNFQVQFMNDLPVEDRSNPSALFVQQPGVTLDGAVTGARTDQNRVTVDGLDVNDYATGEFGAIVANAPVDSVQEFRGVSAGFLSSSAGGGGGQFELVTKSGTNSFHGSLVEYHRDTDLEANDWFNNNSGVPRPPLIRNQFGGSVGGPILKDKLFFYFDLNARRDTLSYVQSRTVPISTQLASNLVCFNASAGCPLGLNYVNASGNLEALPATGAQSVQSLDPQGAGFNSSLESLFSSRYPQANDFSGDAGDLINFAGYRFNAPFPYREYDYVQRVDYNLNEKMKLFGRGTFTRTNATESAIQFPGDPVTSPFQDQSYAWVVSHIWTISANKVNQAYYGEVFENYNFPNTYNPTGATQFGTFGGNGTGGAIMTSPYASAINAQGRTYPIPLVRDDFSWTIGKHDIKIGGTFKWPKPGGYTILNYNSPAIGLGGYTGSLNTAPPTPSLRPADICPESSSTCGYSIGLYDAAYALALAPYTAEGSTFNYNAAGNALPQGSGQTKTYRYNELEIYFGDTWKFTPKLTFSYGLRYINYTVPYEIHGIESIDSTAFDPYFAARNAQSAASQTGNLAVPLIDYTLGGKANHAPGYYKPNNLDFAPRFAFAYQFNPKTVINAGAGIIYDQTVINAVQYQQSQYSYLFQSGVTEDFGFPNDPYDSLASDTRFTGVNNPPVAPTAPPITTPFYPFVSGSGTSANPYVPNGLANGLAFNESIDSNLKTPYSIAYNLGVEHEMPKGFLLRASYVGRLGRRLLAQADAEQLIDFPDPLSGQTMSQAFADVTTQLRAGVAPQNVPAQPWYEDVMVPGTGAAFGLQNNTQVVTELITTLATRGDFADTTQALASLQPYGLGLPLGVGMAPQFSENTFYTNKGSSSYNGMLVTLHKNAGFGLQFDLNYTYSHSIDNVSVIANAPAIGGYGFICDVNRPRECRANSDFDVTNYFNGNFIYDLPFGRGKAFAGTAPRWLDELIGGWSIGGLPSVHSGNAYFASANAFVAGYANDAPAILVGPASDLKIHLHGGQGQPLYAFANASQANADYTGPVGFNIGSRNNLRAPNYFDLDMHLGKRFPIVAERVAVKLGADAFNVLNHPNFAAPNSDITDVAGPFGVINSTVGTGIRNGADSQRVLQVFARIEF